MRSHDLHVRSHDLLDFFLLPYVGRLVDSVYDCTHLITDKVRMVRVHDLPQCMFVVLSKVVRS